MAVLVYAESLSGKLKKPAFEAVSYGKRTADLLGTPCMAIVIGQIENAGHLGLYGADEVYQISGPDHFDSLVYSAAIRAASDKLDADVIIMSHSSSGKSLAGRLAYAMNAGLVSGANNIPDVTSGFTVPKTVFSGKAFANVSIASKKKIITVTGNALPLKSDGQEIQVKSLDVDLPESRIKVKSLEVQEGVVPLPEAELVVSAGRGMKGPENWDIIEDLAEVLGATTACSRPVSDADWRPHHEHVGQTGIAIRPNLYIAAGISGAIQHLAGVNNSKVIVVINKDPEAPFFKAADYGVCADLFDVVPRLTEALKKWKANN